MFSAVEMHNLFLASLLLLRLLEYLLYDLLFFDEEGADDSISYTVGTPRSTVGSRYSLLSFGGRGIFLRS